MPDERSTLTTAALHILVAIGPGERHGYAIMTEVEQPDERCRAPGSRHACTPRSSGCWARISSRRPGERPDPSLDDQRRRYYRLTPGGLAIVAAEVRRLESLVSTARPWALDERRPMSRHERAFRRLVRLYPAAFRAEYEDQMVGLFADQLRDSRTSGDTRAVARLWAQTLIDLVATAPQEHLRKESPVLQPVEPASAPTTPSSIPAAAGRGGHRISAGDPVGSAVGGGSRVHGPCDPQSASHPWIADGRRHHRLRRWHGVVRVARGSSAHGRSGVALGAVAFLTIPALLLIVMTPALILIHRQVG